MAAYTGIKAILRNFRRRTVTQSSSVPVTDTYLTESGITLTMPFNGIALVHFRKDEGGNTIILRRNGIRADLHANFGDYGISGALMCLAAEGDTISVTADGNYGKFHIQNIVMQKI